MKQNFQKHYINFGTVGFLDAKYRVIRINSIKGNFKLRLEDEK